MPRKARAAMHRAQSRRAQIRQLCQRIAHEFKPEKIILFGSHAYGQPTPESDLGLLVVMPFEGDPLEQAIAMLNRLNVLMPSDASGFISPNPGTDSVQAGDGRQFHARHPRAGQGDV
jgi:predicted nucleotidyltransferase